MDQLWFLSGEQKQRQTRWKKGAIILAKLF